MRFTYRALFLTSTIFVAACSAAPGDEPWEGETPGSHELQGPAGQTIKALNQTYAVENGGLTSPDRWTVTTLGTSWGSSTSFTAMNKSLENVFIIDGDGNELWLGGNWDGTNVPEAFVGLSTPVTIQSQPAQNDLYGVLKLTGITYDVDTRILPPPILAGGPAQSGYRTVLGTLLDDMPGIHVTLEIDAKFFKNFKTNACERIQVGGLPNQASSLVLTPASPKGVARFKTPIIIYDMPACQTPRLANPANPSADVQVTVPQASFVGVNLPIAGLAGKCLDDDNDATTNGTSIQLWDCNGTGAQSWTYTTAGQIVGPGGKCLDVRNGDTSNGTRIQLWDCIPGAQGQRWSWGGTGPILGLGGKCLDVEWAQTGNGTPIQLYDCNGTAAQTWAFAAD